MKIYSPSGKFAEWAIWDEMRECFFMLLIRLPKVIWKQAASPPVARPTLRTTPNRSFRTVMQQIPRWLQWGATYSPPKLPSPVDQSTNLTTCLIPGVIQPTKSNPISRFATIHWTDRHTQTNRWLEELFDDNWPLSLYRQWRRGLTIICFSLGFANQLQLL